MPKSLMKGHSTTQGQIEHHFLAFGVIGIVFIEAKLAIVTPIQRLNAIAQVIAECDGQSDIPLL